MDKALLIVDDEENIIRALKRLLRSDGYVIYTANSGRDGLDLLDQNDIHVILSDMRMPEMNGAEFLAKAKQSHPASVRIMLSGYTDLSSVTDAINQGAIYKFMTKPWDDAELCESVKNAFQYYEEKNRVYFDAADGTIPPGAEGATLQDAVAEKRHQADEILEHLPVAVLGMDPGGSVISFNSAARTMFARGEHGVQEALQLLPQASLDRLLHSGSAIITRDNGDKLHITASRFGADEFVIITLAKLLN
ncbi:hypothetical protein Tel_07160 [Candidatus Tenderia electrophaga]|jgi:CheY-like chemotaxis protein|uniref:Response regulatory domain-containing protein n=1 Tax=Candidatus Tenderia electrophaga TaxID=1748243 RepID=A0A0S2TCR5_9GAMM|nr:hypothetical protein Tel_07160 [Candidatus Tenderia electrophaga]